MHPEGGHFYGGAETELCELVRAGNMVLREIVYWDDEVRAAKPCPILLTQLRARDVKSKIGASPESSGYSVCLFEAVHRPFRVWTIYGREPGDDMLWWTRVPERSSQAVADRAK